eukprot:SM003657S13759  [mRNA]  locus=s3657:154:961:- [translate_table: standard]
MAAAAVATTAAAQIATGTGRPRRLAAARPPPAAVMAARRRPQVCTAARCEAAGGSVAKDRQSPGTPPPSVVGGEPVEYVSIGMQSLYLRALGSALSETGNRLALVLEKEQVAEMAELATGVETEPAAQAAPEDRAEGGGGNGSLFLTGLRGSAEDRRQQLL